MSSWFPFFGRDFLTATSGWTAEERGHYVTLLIVQWEQGGLPDDTTRLELISPGLAGCWKTVQEKFPKWKDGKRRNIRLEHERSKSHERSERARQSASKRWESGVSGGDQDEPDKPPDMPEQCERICTSIAGADAPMSMSTKGSSSSAREQLWPRLREAWNTGCGVRWRSSRPSDTVKAALADAAACICGSKKHRVLRPAALAWYIARSACLSQSARPCSWSCNRVTPMLQVPW